MEALTVAQPRVLLFCSQDQFFYFFKSSPTMAPLLGRKPYPLVKPLTEPPGPDEAVYIIQHTKEAFRNKEEYEARLSKYEERIWTCKSTGSGQLTHKEAWEEEQEVTELLQEEFPLWFEKPVLEIVHHNTLSLDKLVDRAWVEILTKYAIGEECDYLVGKEKALRVKVVEVHPLDRPEDEAAEKKLEGACDSPSSNKENASQENQTKELQPTEEEENRRSSICDRARRSPRRLPTTLKEEKKKWVMPKFLPLKYNIKLLDEDKIINNVPADGLFRTERPPNKEIMRYFIRHNSVRLGVGESAPWVVEEELVKKYNLPSKFDDFVLDPEKYMADHSTKKRRSLSSVKKACMEGPDVDKKGVKKKASSNLPLSPSVLGQGNGSPLKVKNASSSKTNTGADSDGSSSSAFQKSGKKQGDKKQTEVKKSQNAATKAAKEKVKQVVLLDTTKAGSSTNQKKASKSVGSGTPKLKPLPPMALHLMRYYKEHKDNEEKKNALSCLISKAAKVLTPEDRSRLPEELQDVVAKRWELLEYKRRWAAMTEEEKQEAMRKKREEIKEKLRERAKERREKEMLVRREQQRRFEDQELVGKSLPNFKLVDMPDSLPNVLFGDIAMVTDFLNCYNELLMPDDQYPVTAAALTEALAAEKGGFLYLNRVLVILLQTLLQDELAEGYSELDMALSEIPLTMYSVSELVRLCLRPSDAQAEGSGRSSGDWAQGCPDDAAASGELLEKLETAEVFELSSQEKVSLLVALCHRILMTYSVEEHVEGMQQRSAELWKERLAALKEANDRVRAEKQRRKELMEAKSAGWVKVEGGSGGLPKTDRKKLGGAKRDGGKEKAEMSPTEPEDMVSTVKSRRLQSMQAKKDKEEQERLNKERMEKEAEEERVKKQKAAAERTFQEGIAKAKLVMRRVPLGTDRNHNRYWLFSDVIPGLYIEKGWIHDSIDYSFTLPPDEEEDDDDEEEEEEQEDGDGEDIKEGCGTEGGQRGVMAVPETSVESTVPNRGQNLWFVCDSITELEELMASLHPQGVRESELKTELQYRYQEIVHSIHMARKASLRLKTCDGHQELLENLRSDIVEVALRLQKGGLGYMDDLKQFEEKVSSLEKLKDFGECVITLQETVIRKFLQGFMAPKKKVQAGDEASRAEEVDDEKKLAEEARVATAVEKWKAMTREAQTFSRMHVLLGMLDACIKWDMSAENARCKVCRKKGDDDKLILCDECNKAFHLFCLRPALYRIPDGEWLCPACQPAGARRAFGRSYEDTGSEDEQSEDDDDDDDESSEENLEDTRITGHYLRSRKSSKRKQSHLKLSSKGVSKKYSPPGSRLGRSKGSPNSLADIDELVRQSSRTGVRREALELEKCEEILQKLVKFRYSWPFREPVSPREAEDYLEVISNPMDFQTMLRKFSDGSYRHSGDFLEDLKLVFSNTEEYNQPGSTVLSCLAKTEQVFVDLLCRLLPGVSYHRRRKRVRRNCERNEEEEEEREQEANEERARGSAKSRRTARQECESSRHSCQRRWEEEETEEEEQESSHEQEHMLRKSKRLAVVAERKDYREVESDSDQEEQGRGTRSHSQPWSRRRRSEGVDEGGSDEDRIGVRRSKRQKHSL